MMTMTTFRSLQGYSVVSGLVGLATVVVACTSGTIPSAQGEAPGQDAGVDSTTETLVDDDISIPTPSGMGGGAACGVSLGTYRKVTVFAPGNHTAAKTCGEQTQCEGGYKSVYGQSLICATKSGVCGAERAKNVRTEYGLAYQCVEYVRRFLAQRYHGGLSSPVPCLGNAIDWWTWTTRSTYFRERYRNGEATIPPQPDDIVVFYAVASGAQNQIGHVAVVRRVSADRVWVAQQNVSGHEADANYPLDIRIENGSINLSDAGGSLTGYAVAGWIRNPDNDPYACGTDQTCPDDYTCLQGKCGPCTQKESDAAFCARLGKTCGSTTASDICGTDRTVNCGACTCPSDCSGHGSCNSANGVCSCAAGYAGAACDSCGTGYGGYPNCVRVYSCPSDCNGHGTCDTTTGICTCAARYAPPACATCATGYAGTGCDSCDTGYVGYPNCVLAKSCPSDCSGLGTCDTYTGICACAAHYATPACAACITGYAGDACDVPTTCNGGNVCAAGLVCSPIVAAGACYNAEWTKWHMPPDEGTYSLPTAGTVRDEVSKLLWQRTVPTPTYNWADAKRYCAGLTLDGISGWRLPTVIELVSLLDYTRSGPAIYAVPFPSTPSEAFWTSTVVAGSTGQAWWVRFSDGGTWIDNASVVHRVRCVR